MLSPNDTFKEQMAEARRTQILMGAAQVFAEKGFHKATTKEIAKAAEVSEGTIYNYFDSKRELLFALIDLIGVRSLKVVVQDHINEDPRLFLKAVLRDRYQLVQERGQFVAPILAEIVADADLREEVYKKIGRPIALQLEQYIQTQIEAGLFRRVNPVIVTRAFIGSMLFNASLKLTNLDDRYESISVEAMIDQLVSLFLDGLLLKSDTDPTGDNPDL